MIAEQSQYVFFVTRSLDDRKMGSLETIFQNESEEIVERSSTGVCRNDRSSLQQRNRWNTERSQTRITRENGSFVKVHQKS